MPKIQEYREKLNLTQEELAEKSGLSVRTIQRIEAGAKLKGHTLNALANALGIEKDILVNTKSAEYTNLKLVKWINLSSLPFILIPFANILVPAILIYKTKEYNALTKQIVSIQILWTIISAIVFFLSPFINRLFSVEIRITLIVLVISILINILIIVLNSIELDRNKKLLIRLNFSMV
ncbi:helix-turn-helix domain-containing protein [Aquimarina algicola]|uniref:Helix-turn-helix transcriptional regulator n=1 Tax=Aquimarina algicola TaxID=2589995 RepID=A0A504IY04_9FLAO|nr:helix-turn-helix transcriptional regulator [Aquimarina algicola]TPN82904.1 helix-turn-helix transcriptional regulator [Aquimarina algicola]